MWNVIDPPPPSLLPWIPTSQVCSLHVIKLASDGASGTMWLLEKWTGARENGTVFIPYYNCSHTQVASADVSGEVIKRVHASQSGSWCQTELSGTQIILYLTAKETLLFTQYNESFICNINHFKLDFINSPKPWNLSKLAFKMQNIFWVKLFSIQTSAHLGERQLIPVAAVITSAALLDFTSTFHLRRDTVPVHSCQIWGLGTETYL